MRNAVNSQNLIPNIFLTGIQAKRGTTFRCLESHHHSIGCQSRKNPPVGPSIGQRGGPDDTCGAFLDWSVVPPMSVATQPGQTALTRMPLVRNSAATTL